MPLYNYEALNATGKCIRSQIEAVSTEDAIWHIKAMGYFPTSVRETGKSHATQHPLHLHLQDNDCSINPVRWKILLLGVICGILLGVPLGSLILLFLHK